MVRYDEGSGSIIKTKVPYITGLPDSPVVALLSGLNSPRNLTGQLRKNNKYHVRYRKGTYLYTRPKPPRPSSTGSPLQQTISRLERGISHFSGRLLNDEGLFCGTSRLSISTASAADFTAQHTMFICSEKVRAKIGRSVLVSKRPATCTRSSRQKMVDLALLVSEGDWAVCEQCDADLPTSVIRRLEENKRRKILLEDSRQVQNWKLAMQDDRSGCYSATC